MGSLPARVRRPQSQLTANRPLLKVSKIRESPLVVFRQSSEELLRVLEEIAFPAPNSANIQVNPYNFTRT